MIEFSKETILPSGDYFAQVVKIAEAQTRFQCQSLEIQYRILTGPHAGETLRSWINYQPPASPQGKLARFVRAAGGDPASGQVDFVALLGARLVIHVEVKHSRNVVTDFEKAT